jgi:hypothetical protein
MSNESFLPEDYLARRAERRTNYISMTLFVVVMIAVFGAFLVTNRQWSQVKSAQETINAQYHEAAMKIQELGQLETQREQMLDKAELIGSLVERVPRSILLAELINRMPPRLSLLEFELDATEIKPQRKAGDDEKSKGGKRLSKPKRAKTKEEVIEEQAEQKLAPPKLLITIEMVGVAPTDIEISRFMAELLEHELLDSVRLDYSEQKDVDGQDMRQFKIILKLDPEADVRNIEPLYMPRNLKDPMSDEVMFPSGNSTATAPTGGGAGG